MVQRGTRRIVGGHGRVEALRALGETHAAVVEIELDSTEATALAIALNRTAELAGWDDTALAALLESLPGDLADVAGFSEAELGALLDALAPAPEIVEDEIPEPPDDPVTKPGELIVLGDHRLLCGDSASADDVDRLLDGSPIHLVNTDPPYDVLVEPASGGADTGGQRPSWRSTESIRKFQGKAPSKTKAKQATKGRRLANDFLTDEEFDEVLLAWFGTIARVLEPGCSFYIWGGGYPGDATIKSNNESFPRTLRAVGLHFAQTVIWVKEHPVINRKDFMGNREWCFYGWKKGEAHRFFGGNVSDVWSAKKVSPQSMVHLCLHPEALVLTEAGYRPISSHC